DRTIAKWTIRLLLKLARSSLHAVITRKIYIAPPTNLTRTAYATWHITSQHWRRHVRGPHGAADSGIQPRCKTSEQLRRRHVRVPSRIYRRRPGQRVGQRR